MPVRFQPFIGNSSFFFHHLVLKAIPEDNQRFWLQSQWPSSCIFGQRVGTAQACQIASTNTGPFQIGCSRCWLLLFCFRKKYYHSYDIDLNLVYHLESKTVKKINCFTHFVQWQQTFSRWKWNINGFRKNLLQTKAALMASINLVKLLSLIGFKSK